MVHAIVNIYLGKDVEFLPFFVIYLQHDILFLIFCKSQRFQTSIKSVSNNKSARNSFRSVKTNETWHGTKITWSYSCL